ncbi:hypothetical protein TKK_0004497 [Trichogramma kaykai]|uniref:Low molecular weight phosphotyrosine protein phosphatase n=1 Tax=Trichogramma kaykai TaxID=54128 RepID=A0ABD2XLY0_9HYME
MHCFTCGKMNIRRSGMKKRVLMVCFGNTCRSPIAEAIFHQFIRDNEMQDEWEVDSAGLVGYHEGENINSRSAEVLKKNGIGNYFHIARTIKKEDFDTFDWILGMDYYNLQDLSYMQPKGSKAKLGLLGEYDPEGKMIIEDPYLDRDAVRFEEIFHHCKRCIPIFIDKVG